MFISGASTNYNGKAYSPTIQRQKEQTDIIIAEEEKVCSSGIVF